MTPKPGEMRPEDAARSAQAILGAVVFELGERVSARGIMSEEMIRVSGFFESAKALWLATAADAPMPEGVLAHRLQVLVDICPPELSEFGERLERSLRSLNDAAERFKRRA